MCGILTTKNRTGFIDDRLDMYRRFFSLGGDVTTRGDDDEGVRFAVRVLEIEPAKEHRCGGSYSLAEGHFLAYPCDH